MDGAVNLNTGQEGLRQVLGELEAEIMERMWDRGSSSVRDIYECLAERREIAYTTVMTVMGRLADKGLLSRRQQGRAYLYSPSETRGSFCAGVVRSVVEGLFGGANRPVLAHFVEQLSEEDGADLDMLAAIIDEKRRERRSSTPLA